MIRVIILNIICLLILPFLFIGIINRVKSFWAGKRGASIFHPYYDFIKLLGKGEVISVTASFVFSIAPSIALASVVTAGLFVPMIGHKALLSFSGDFVLFAYILAMGKFFLVISAMDTGSSFSGMGASREVTFSSLVEPAFFIIIASLSAFSGENSFSSIFLSIQKYSDINLLIVVLSSIALFMMILVEGKRVPVDDPNTHLELTMIHEVMILDNSGPDLALMQYAAGIKCVIFGSIIANLIIPLTVGVSMSVLFLFGILFLLAVLIGLTESVIARFRMVHIPQFVFFISALALIIMSIVALMNYGGLKW